MRHDLGFEVFEVGEGEKIDRPGVYSMPMEWYHADCCVGPSISSSGLRKIRLYSPGHFWAYSALNPERAEDKEDAEKMAFRLGRATHHLLLDKTDFEARYKIRPAMWDDWRTKAAKEWRAEQWKAGVTVMSGEEMAQVKGMAAALAGHAVHRDGILDGAIELSLIWQDPNTGVWLKSRPDAIPLSGAMMADIKCLHDARRRPLALAVQTYGFDQQMALAGIGSEMVIKRKVEDFVVVAVETKLPHAIAIRPIDHDRIYWSRCALRYSVNTFATCWRQKEWPTYEHDDGLHVMMDEWEKVRNKEEQAAGILPKDW